MLKKVGMVFGKSLEGAIELGLKDLVLEGISAKVVGGGSRECCLSGQVGVSLGPEC